MLTTAALVVVLVASFLTGPATAADDPVQGVLDSIPGSQPPEESPATTTTTAPTATAPPATAPARRTAPHRSKTSGAAASTTTTPVTADESAYQENILLDRYGEPLDGQQVFAAPRRQPYPPSAFIPASGGLSGQRGGGRSSVSLLVAGAAAVGALAGATTLLKQWWPALQQT